MADQERQWQLLQVGPDERETLDSQVAIIEMQREAIRDAIREKGEPLTDEELNNIRQSYSPTYGNTDLDYTKDQMSFIDKTSGITHMYEAVPGLAYGGSPDQEFINDRIVELMMEEPLGNEMRASSPDVFQKQEQAIESFLGGIGQFADEKNIPFLRALADPSYTRNVAESTSFGAEMTPGLGDIQAIREGSRMMGDDQSAMGALFIGGSLLGLPSAKLKKLLKKAQQKLEDARTLEYNSKSYMKRDLSDEDNLQGYRMNRTAQTDKATAKTEIAEINEALKAAELRDQVKSFDEELLPMFDDFKKETTPWLRGKEELASVSDINRKRVEKALVEQKNLFDVPLPTKTPKQVRKENLKGIVNANAETRKLYQEIIDSPSRINTKDHQKVAKETSEQLREIQKGIDNADLEDRNEVIRLLADLKNKKPK